MKAIGIGIFRWSEGVVGNVDILKIILGAT